MQNKHPYNKCNKKNCITLINNSFVISTNSIQKIITRVGQPFLTNHFEEINPNHQEKFKQFLTI